VKLRCGISDGKGKLCDRELEPISFAVFAAGYVDPGTGPLRLGRCPKHKVVFAPEDEIQAAATERQAAIHLSRLARRSTRR
jgi:hypothetical protein